MEDIGRYRRWISYFLGRNVLRAYLIKPSNRDGIPRSAGYKNREQRRLCKKMNTISRRRGAEEKREELVRRIRTRQIVPVGRSAARDIVDTAYPFNDGNSKVGLW